MENMTPKTANERKTLAGWALPYATLCHSIEPLSVWPVQVRKKGSKAGRKKVTRSVYFTYVWSGP